jgi:hypothetical protein
MAVTYVNRQKKTYYLHVGLTKKGNPKYYLALTSDGNLADRIPEGFEIHEKASGQVVVRRTRPQLITEEELKAVERELAQVKEARKSYAEREGEFIAVYVARQSNLLEETFRRWRPLAAQTKLEELTDRFLKYDEVFRFVLTNSEKRLFQTQRFCYLGSIDDWIFIGEEASIQKLAHQYLPHINQDSYYELM